MSASDHDIVSSFRAPVDGLKTGAVLLAVHDIAERGVIEGALLAKGYGVRAVEDATQLDAALDAVRHRTVDVVIADAMLAGLDELRKAARGGANRPGIPLILLTSSEDDGAGDDDSLARPFRTAQLLARVGAHLRMARFCDEREAVLQRQVERFEKLLSQVPMGIYMFDADFRIREANTAALAMFGEISGGVLGRDIREIIRQIWEVPYADEILAIFQHTLQTGEPYVARERAEPRLDSGTTEYYEWRVDRIPLTDGAVGVVCYLRNVSERKRAELNANLLASIVESSQDAIISKGLDGRIRSWNRGAERLFGYLAEEAIGQPIEILIPLERRQEEPRIIERLKRGERVEHFETVRVRKDGREVNLSLTISPLRDLEGRIVGASKVARDVTLKVWHEKELQRANTALERANSDLQHFAYSASHDLQEPLRMVAVYSEMLRRKFSGQLGAAGDEYLGYTLLGAKRMENLLRNLRTYMHVSTLPGGQVEEVDAGVILARTLQNLAVAIEASEANVSSTALPKVRIYEFQLEQIFQNLIANAIRYRRDDPLAIAVTADRRGNEWLFSVQDNGIGIEQRFQEQIFGVFKRLHGAAEYSGTGMGLAICQRAIERAGGRIWVESSPGRGSTFFFTVPAVAAAVQ